MRSLKQIFDLYNLFNRDVLHQLTFLVFPLLGGFGGLFVFSFLLLSCKNGRATLGRVLLATNATYLALIVMLLSLPLTNTSYGLAQPVAIVFGVIFLLILDFGLLVLNVALRFARLARHWRGLTLTYGAGLVVVLGLLFYTFYIEPQWLDITQTKITLPKLLPGTPPIKVALISDIHMERWTGREREVVRELENIKPDLLLIAGDHINIDHYEAETYPELQRFFTAIAPTAKYGTYAVAGLTERYNLADLLDGTGVKFINDNYTSLEVRRVELYLTGIRSHQAEVDAPVLDAITKKIPQNAIKLLLYHTPDLAPEAASEGYDFYFAGHTHGGQISLPFYGAMFAGSKFGRTHAAGLYNLGGGANTRLYVTRGLGFEGFNAPRARLFARPEISVITFVPAQ